MRVLKNFWKAGKKSLDKKVYPVLILQSLQTSFLAPQLFLLQEHQMKNDQTLFPDRDCSKAHFWLGLLSSLPNQSCLREAFSIDGLFCVCKISSYSFVAKWVSHKSSFEKTRGKKRRAISFRPFRFLTNAILFR